MEETSGRLTEDGQMCSRCQKLIISNICGDYSSHSTPVTWRGQKTWKNQRKRHENAKRFTFYRCKDIKQTRAELQNNILIKYSYFYGSLLPRFLLSDFLGLDNSAWELNPRPADRIVLTDLQTPSSSSLHHPRHRNIKHTSSNTCDSALTRDVLNQSNPAATEVINQCVCQKPIYIQFVVIGVKPAKPLK